MSTTLSKTEYRKILATQKVLQEELSEVKRVLAFMSRDELIPEKVKKLLNISNKLDRGNGKRFGSSRVFANYLRGL